MMKKYNKIIEREINWREIVLELSQRLHSDSFTSYHGGSMNLNNYTGLFNCRAQGLYLTVLLDPQKSRCLANQVEKFISLAEYKELITPTNQMAMF